MTKIAPFHTLEEGIDDLKKEMKEKPSLTIETILSVLSGKGRPLLIILLALPFCQPIQIPGLSIPFGLVIAFIGLRMTFGKHIWLPEKLLRKTVSTTTLEKITDKAHALIKKIKRWIHPRIHWACHSLLMEKLNGVTLFLSGILLALPLPIPLSNIAAAWAIFLIALGVLEDDGLFVLIGYFLLLLTLSFFIIIALYFLPK